MKKKILIVDDEIEILHMIKEYFEMKQYTVLIARNGMEALELLSECPNIILLDINMPKISGIELCTKIRDFVKIPIVFLTAKIDESDKIIGFKSGADDYIVKPFSLLELEVRVEAHIRRDIRNIKEEIVVNFVGNITIDYLKREVLFCNNKLNFTKKEFEIIELLTLNKGQVFDKDRIYNKLWSWDSDGDSSVVVEHIRRIRDKFKEIGLEKEHIRTVWGVGYIWED